MRFNPSPLLLYIEPGMSLRNILREDFQGRSLTLQIQRDHIPYHNPLEKTR